MDSIFSFLGGVAGILDLTTLSWCFVGCLVGTLVGVLPGIGPMTALSLLLPATFALPPLASLVMLTSIFYGAMFGGSTTSILLNIPGEAASVVTCLDGYPMMRKGRGGVALSIAAIGSFLAGLMGLLLLVFFSPSLAGFALLMGPPENAGIMLLGLITAVFMIRGDRFKGLVMIVLGLLLSCIGTDLNGAERFTFGSARTVAGLELVAVCIGLFGIVEILVNVERVAEPPVFVSKLRNLLPNRSDWRQSWPAILRATGIGFVFGILPGGGPVSGTFVSYAVERRLSKTPEAFGEGAIAGVAGPESANNAAVVGSLVPLLSLGLPSSPITALLLGALILQGIQPGPLLMQQNPDLYWGVIASMAVSSVILLTLNLPLVGLWVQMLRIPYAALLPLILLCAVIGTYAINLDTFDLWVMLAFGVGGYVFTRAGYELAPFVLAWVLGPLLEQAVRQSIIMSRQGAMIFVTRPISGVLFAVAALLLVLVIWRPKTREGTSIETAT